MLPPPGGTGPTPGTSLGVIGTTVCGRPFSFVAGSPKKIHPRRKSEEPTALLVSTMAWPSVGSTPENSHRSSSALTPACACGGVNVDDPQTATAPPGARSSASARLSSCT